MYAVYAPDHSPLREKLRERGRKQMFHCGPRFPARSLDNIIAF